MQRIPEYYYMYLSMENWLYGIKFITLVIESYVKFAILIKLQTKIKKINPFWSICSVVNLKFLLINNINIIIELRVIQW